MQVILRQGPSIFEVVVCNNFEMLANNEEKKME